MHRRTRNPAGGLSSDPPRNWPCQFASDPALWTNIHFAAPAWNHPRRVRRLQTIALAMAASPGLSLPQLFPQWLGGMPTSSLVITQPDV